MNPDTVRRIPVWAFETATGEWKVSWRAASTPLEAMQLWAKDAARHVGDFGPQVIVIDTDGTPSLWCIRPTIEFEELT